MPQTWFVESPPRGHAIDAASVAMLLDAPHDAAPAAQMLTFLNQIAPVEYLSLVKYTASDTQHTAPTLIEGHAHGLHARDVTAECFAIYRRNYWRSDQATQIAQHLHNSQGDSRPVTALNFHPGDIPVAAWRDEIYDREHLSDRLSFIYAPLPHTAFAINLYRDDAMGTFQPAEIERLLAVATLLRQVHQGALRLGQRGNTVRLSLETRIGMALTAINNKAPTLSPREAAVCARIACGISAEGIAAELGIAPSTVLTLRKRAYAKLADLGMGSGRMQLARLTA